MPRATNSVASRQRRKKILKRARGNWGGRGNQLRSADTTVKRGLAYGYRDRRQKKRAFRALWIVRINAAARLCGLSYSRLMNGLQKAGIAVDRKVLAHLAATEPGAFAALADRAKQSF